MYVCRSHKVGGKLVKRIEGRSADLVQTRTRAGLVARKIRYISCPCDHALPPPPSASYLRLANCSTLVQLLMNILQQTQAGEACP